MHIVLGDITVKLNVNMWVFCMRKTVENNCAITHRENNEIIVQHVSCWGIYSGAHRFWIRFWNNLRGKF